MGCSASVAPSTTIQSIQKVDVGTDTMDSKLSIGTTHPIETVKQLIETSTQTDDLEVQVKTNEIKPTEEIHENRDLFLKDTRTVELSNERNESVDPLDNYINSRFNQEFDYPNQFGNCYIKQKKRMMQLISYELILPKVIFIKF